MTNTIFLKHYRPQASAHVGFYFDTTAHFRSRAGARGQMEECFFEILFCKSKINIKSHQWRGALLFFVFTDTWSGVVCMWVSTCVCLLLCLCFWGTNTAGFVSRLGMMRCCWLCECWGSRWMLYTCGCGVWDWVLFVAHLIQLFAQFSFWHLHQRCLLCGYVHCLSS